jgi:hypothetical protein
MRSIFYKLHSVSLAFLERQTDDSYAAAKERNLSYRTLRTLEFDLHLQN